LGIGSPFVLSYPTYLGDVGSFFYFYKKRIEGLIEAVKFKFIALLTALINKVPFLLTLIHKFFYFCILLKEGNMKIKKIAFFIFLSNYTCVAISMERLQIDAIIEDSTNQPPSKTFQHKLFNLDAITDPTTSKLTPRDSDDIRNLLLLRVSQKKTEHISSEISKTYTKEDIEEITKDLANKVHIDPELMVNALYELCGEDNKKPLPEEKKQYQKLQKKQSKYQQTTEALLTMVLINMLKENQEESQNNSDETLLETQTKAAVLEEHVGQFRQINEQKNAKIENKDWWLNCSTALITILSIVAAGMTIWASYAQAHSSGGESCSNNTAA
jgi:hypothetical protein